VIYKRGGGRVEKRRKGRILLPLSGPEQYALDFGGRGGGKLGTERKAPGKDSYYPIWDKDQPPRIAENWR